MTKNNLSFRSFAAIAIVACLVSPKLFANTAAEEQKALAAAKTAADLILNDANTASAQKRLCKLAEDISDVVDSLGNKKVGGLTDTQYNTIKKQQLALQTIEAFQAHIEAQKLASSTFKSKYSNECVGKNNEPFEISFAVTKFRGIYERFSKVPPPKPRPTTRGAGGTLANGSRAPTPAAGAATPANAGLINSSCDIKEMKDLAFNTFAILYDEKEKKSTKAKAAPPQIGMYGNCNYYFELQRVADKIFVLDRQSQRKPPKPQGEEVASSAELFDVLRRSRSPAPAGQPQPAIKSSPATPEAPAKRNNKT